MSASLQSPEDVVNAALDIIGWDRRVGDIFEGTKASKLALDIFGQTRDELMRKMAPGFAIRDVTVSAVKAAPAAGYTAAAPWSNASPPSPWLYEYPYPSDCLKFLYPQSLQTPIPNNAPLPQRFKMYNDQATAPVARYVLANVGNTLVTSMAMTATAPAVVTAVDHGLYVNTPVVFNYTSGGSLPTGVTAGTTYYVVAAGLTSSTFEFAATAGGSAITTTGSPSADGTLSTTAALFTYIGQVTDMTTWDPLFTELLVEALAKKFTVALTKNAQLVDGVLKAGTQGEMVTEGDAAQAEET